MIGAETVKSDQLQGFVMATFKSPYPKLWDPHTCGKQSLHVLIAALCREKALFDAASKRFGREEPKSLSESLTMLLTLLFFERSMVSRYPNSVATAYPQIHSTNQLVVANIVIG